MILAWLAVGVSTFSLLLLTVMLLRWRSASCRVIELEEWPFVSVLVPARNEEKNLPRCIDSLLGCDYPSDKLEILIANDHSNDRTATIIKEYASKHPQVRFVEVGEPIGNAQAKANALVYLSQNARYDWWLCTDADIAVPTQWLKSMVGIAIDREVDLVAGVTVVQGEHGFAQLQRLDWMMGWGMIQLGVETGAIVTAAGNNMLISRRAYEAVGGYQKLPRSVTEDYILYQAVRRAGYGVYHEFSKESKAFTLAEQTIGSLLIQRKRWMKGAMSLPWWLVASLFIQSLYFPALMVVIWLSPLIGGLFFFLKALLQVLFLRKVGSRIQEQVRLGWLGFYEIYSSLLPTLLLIYYMWPSPIRWKGRKL